MAKVEYQSDGRIGRITLNRPDVLNAIDNDVPSQLADCVARANADDDVHVIVLEWRRQGVLCRLRPEGLC